MRSYESCRAIKVAVLLSARQLTVNMAATSRQHGGNVTVNIPVNMAATVIEMVLQKLFIETLSQKQIYKNTLRGRVIFQKHSIDMEEDRNRHTRSFGSTQSVFGWQIVG